MVKISREQSSPSKTPSYWLWYTIRVAWGTSMMMLLFLFSFSSSCATIASEWQFYDATDSSVLSTNKRCKLIWSSTTSQLPYNEELILSSAPLVPSSSSLSPTQLAPSKVLAKTTDSPSRITREKNGNKDINAEQNNNSNNKDLLPEPLSLPKTVPVNVELPRQESEICYPADQVRIEIYMYHYVRPLHWDTPWSVVYNNSITPELARDHYKYLSQLQSSDRINIAYMSEIETFERQNCFPNTRMVVLSFDDGRRDNYEYMLPLAKEFNIKANLWIIVNRITSWTEERIDSFMNFQEILEMKQSWFFEIQSHSWTHTNLQQKWRDEQWTEICESTKYLEEIFDIEINSFIYPMGLYDANSTAIASDCWLTYALSTREWIDTKYTLETLPFQLNRIRVNKWVSGRELFGE